MPQADYSTWDTKYERNVILILFLGFGVVGLDRMIIAPLFPFMQADLGLSDGAIGYLSGVLGMVWGVFAIVGGAMADRIGHRKILIPAMVVVSLMCGLTGMMHALVWLAVVRALMGVAEGAYATTMVAATAAASKPTRRGFNLGFQQCGFPLFGLALAPIIATQLLNVLPSWREVFWVAAIPGVIVAALLFFVLKEPQETQGAELLGITEKGGSYLEVLKSRNIVVAMIALLFVMSGVFILSAMVPVYLTNVLALSPVEMGIVAAAIGFGGFCGQFGWPGLSDLLGRKTATIIGFVGSTLCIIWFAQLDGGVLALFIPLFIACFFLLGNISVMTGPICTESAPPGLVATSIGLVVGIGEIFGGGVAPIMAGFFADTYGLPSVLTVAFAATGIGIVVACFFRETAPRKKTLEEAGPVA